MTTSNHPTSPTGSAPLTPINAGTHWNELRELSMFYDSEALSAFITADLAQLESEQSRFSSRRAAKAKQRS